MDLWDLKVCNPKFIFLTPKISQTTLISEIWNVFAGIGASVQTNEKRTEADGRTDKDFQIVI